MMLPVFQIKKGAMADRSADNHVSSLPAISTIRAATGDKFFPPEADAAFSTITCLYEYFDFIDKFHMLILSSPGLPNCSIGMVKKQHFPFVKKTKGTLFKSAFLSFLAMKRKSHA